MEYCDTLNTVFCPVLNGQINGDDCLEICEVADRMIKPFVLYDTPAVLPEGVLWNEILRRKCLTCPYHNDLD